MLRRFKKSIILILGLTLALVSSCSRTAVKNQTAAIGPEGHQLKTVVLPRPQEAERLDPRAFNEFVNGTLYEQVGDLPNAARSYANALQIYPNSYEIRYSLAMVLYRQQLFPDALEVLSHIDPEDAAVYEIRGGCYRLLGDEAKTKEAFLKVVELDSLNSNAYSYLASVYRRDNDFDSLIWSYNNLLRIRPSLYRLHTELGKLYARLGNLVKARESFRASIEVDPEATNTLAYVGLGEMYEAAQMTDSALQTYKAGLAVDSNDVLLNRMLGNLYVHLDSINQAIPLARRVVTISPQDKAAQRRLASMLYAADSLQESDSIFSALLAIGDRHPINFYYLGRIAALRDNFERAVRFFIPLTQVLDTSSQSWIDLGYAYRQLDRLDKEIESYRTGLNHMRDEESAKQLYFALGAAYEQSGDLDKATETFEELIARSPDHSQALNYLGYMLADHGQNLEYARELIKKALEIVPDNPAYLDSYGWVFYKLGDYKKARKHLSRAVELDTDPVIFDHLGDAYHADGDLQTAKVWWQKALDLTPDDEKIMEKLKLESQ
ncbi:MAG: tetratricopeptide repeat protein [bacterium]|nr:tetratricopeptide repeat protein [bacterium]